MDIKIANQGNGTIVTLDGRLDTPASLDAAPLFESLNDKADGAIVLDCSRLSYISSSGLRLFLTLRKAAGEKGGKIIVKDLTPEVRSVFMITGFLNLFQIEA